MNKPVMSLINGIALLCISLNVLASEKDTYDFLWLDPDKSVYVLQNKLHKKEKSFYVDLGYVSTQTGAFQETSGFALKGGYFFHEEWGVEALYIGYNNSNNDNYTNVTALSGVAPFVRRPKTTKGLGVVWSPFYGKINTFNKIVHFDVSFTAGLAQVETEDNMASVLANSTFSTYKSETNTGLYFKATSKFYLNERWNVGLEWIRTNYQAPGPRNPKEDKFRTNNDIVFQVGVSF
jgi:outer membrane beta-barrel protein